MTVLPRAMEGAISETEPDAFQVKYYAPDVGNIKVSWRGEDATEKKGGLYLHTKNATIGTYLLV